MFIGRKKELDLLETLYASNHSSLLILHGSKLIGKTSLAQQFCLSKPHFYYSFSNLPTEFQLSSLQKSLLNHLTKISSQYLTASFTRTKLLSNSNFFKNIFYQLSSIDFNQRHIFVIDNFELVSKNYTDFLNCIIDLWETLLVHSNLMVIIICNTDYFSQNSLEGYFKILKDNISTSLSTIKSLELLPISLPEAFIIYKSLFGIDLIEKYLLTCGLPGIIETFDLDKSCADNLKAMLTAPACILREFIENLLNGHFRDMRVYNLILYALSNAPQRICSLSEIAQIKNNVLSVYLNNLYKQNIIKKKYIYDIESKKISQSAYYEISNELVDFYYKFLFGNEHNQHIVETEVFQFKLKDFFEKHMEKHIIRYALEKHFEWKNSLYELVYILGSTGKLIPTLYQAKDNKTLVFDVSFSEHVYDRVDFNNFISSIQFESFFIKYVIFSKKGFSSSLYRIAAEHNIYLITPDKTSVEL